MKMLNIKHTLKDAVSAMQNVEAFQDGDLFIVLETFDFGRDVNGNSINKYSAWLVSGGSEDAAANGYLNAFGPVVLTSPYRREQSVNRGVETPLFKLGQLGYELKEARRVEIPTGYRFVYRVTNDPRSKVAA